MDMGVIHLVERACEMVERVKGRNGEIGRDFEIASANARIRQIIIVKTESVRLANVEAIVANSRRSTLAEGSKPARAPTATQEPELSCQGVAEIQGRAVGDNNVTVGGAAEIESL